MRKLAITTAAALTALAAFSLTAGGFTRANGHSPGAALLK